MPKVKQHAFLSPQAVALRKRDGIPPWGVHVCEVDALADSATGPNPGLFAEHWRRAAELRRQIEAEPH